RVLAPGMRRVVAAPHRHLAEAEARIDLLRGEIARAHLEKYIARAEAAREGGGFGEQPRAVAAALMRGGDRQVENMRLARRRHQHEVADQRAAEPPGAAFVAGAQRIDEVAARPGMGVDRALDRHHFLEIALAHRLEPGDVLEDRAHLFCSSMVSAILSRT